MKKVVSLILVVCLSIALVACGGGQETGTAPETEAPAAPETPEAPEPAAPEGPKVRTVVEREDALPGNAITPADFPKSFLPGIENVGAVPLKKYKIAISNGDMANEWRRTFWEDMMKYADLYSQEFGIEIISANSGNNSTKQLQDVQGLLAQQPDLLLISPNEAGPLNAVNDMCRQVFPSLPWTVE